MGGRAHFGKEDWVEVGSVFTKKFVNSQFLFFNQRNIFEKDMKEKTKEKIEDAVYFIVTLICIIIALGFLGFLVYGLLAGP